MKIPETIKISGHIYTVKIVTDRIAQDGSHNPASSWQKNNTIWIDGAQCQQRQETSLMHEILEMIDYDFGLKFEHNVINTLETALYQVLKDNNLLRE